MSLTFATAGTLWSYSSALTFFLFSGVPQLYKGLYDLFQTDRSHLLSFTFVCEFHWTTNTFI